MGLSCKQVSSDGLGWNQALLQAQTLELPKANSPMKRQHPQNQHQQTEPPLKCPRCDSANTKFCYYNNYNKSQPRHFCKACKRHWTKGGTLRNVPVGGGRKNKRLKTSSNTNTAATAATPAIKNSSTTSGVNNRLMINNVMSIQPQQQQRQDHDQLPLADHDQKNMSNNMQFRALRHPPSSFLQQKFINHSNLDSSKSFSTSNNDLFLGSTLSLPQTQGLQIFPFSSSSSFETPSSISTSFQSSSIYNYSTGETTMEDPTITSITQPWQVPITNSTNYWNWDDIDALVSTDLNMPWDDSQIKP